MPDDLNTTQETVETPIPQDTPVNMGSSTSDTPSEAPESPINADTPVQANNDNQESNSPESLSENEGVPAENPPAEPNPEPVSEPIQAPDSGTAQIPGNEPLSDGSEPLGEPVNSEPVSAPSSSETEPVVISSPVQQTNEPVAVPPIPTTQNSRNRAIELLAKAKLAIQSRKRKKLDKIMTLFLKNQKITNDEVEKFLHVSDATAERYLNILEKENKIKQVGKTGKAVSYSRI